MTEKIACFKATVFWSEHQVLNKRQFGYLKGSPHLHNFAVAFTTGSPQVKLENNRCCFFKTSRKHFTANLTKVFQLVDQLWYLLPEGTILRHILFLIYLYDRPNIVKSSVKLVARETYLLLTEFEGRTVNYNLRFSPSIYGPRAKRVGQKSKGKNRVRNLQYWPGKEVSKLLIRCLYVEIGRANIKF